MQAGREWQRSLGGPALVALVLGAVLSGCAESRIPGATRYAIHYADTLTVALESETPFLVFETISAGEAGTARYDSTIYSLYAGDSLELRLEIRGYTYEPDSRAVLDHRWDADTLFVWCALDPPPGLGYGRGGDRTSLIPPFLSLASVVVVAPLGIGIVYWGERFY